MINLSSLSALIRAIRHAHAADAAAPAVVRVAAITPVAEDDAGAMTSTALRRSPWSSSVPLPDLAASNDASAPSVRESRASASAANAAPFGAAQANSASATVQSTALELTAAARMLQSALRGTGLRAPLPAAITSPMPLASDSRAPAAAIARALEQAIAGSGLFYESHLARVLRRDYPLAALSREPQAAWPSGMLSPDAGASPAAPATEAASTMLGKQLDVLDTRALVWNGDVWPGQRATIALREDLEGDAANDADVDAVGPSWRMRIALELPSLGRVQASIVLRDGGVDFVVAAANESAQARLDAAKAALAEALTRTDVAFARIAVERGPDR